MITYGNISGKERGEWGMFLFQRLPQHYNAALQRNVDAQSKFDPDQWPFQTVQQFSCFKPSFTNESIK